jgi:hypothetical protein
VFVNTNIFSIQALIYGMARDSTLRVYHPNGVDCMLITIRLELKSLSMTNGLAYCVRLVKSFVAFAPEIGDAKK